MPSKRPTTPLCGFDDQLQPVTEVSIAGRERSSSTGSIGHPRRNTQRRLSGPWILAPVPENDLSPPRIDSLEWDAFNFSALSDSTQFNPNLSRLSTSTEIDLARLSVSTHNVSINNSQNSLDLDLEIEIETMAVSQKKQHRISIRKAAAFVEDDLPRIRPESMRVDSVKQKLDQADLLKVELQNAMLYLQEVDGDEYKDQLESMAENTKKSLLDFIYSTEGYLQQQQDVSVSNSVDKNPAHDIQQSRVNEYKQATLGDLQNLIDEFQVLSTSTPQTDVQVRHLENRFKEVVEQAQFSLSVAKDLLKDAQESGLAQDSKDIQSHIHKLQTALCDNRSKLNDTKVNFGITGSPVEQVSTVMDPPVFSGDSSDKHDFYSFKSEFEEFVSQKCHSNLEQIRLLTKTCLQGSAKVACINLTSLEEIWRKLKDNFGNTKILFSSKVDEIRKMGPCQGSFAQKRKWVIDMKAKVDYVEKIANDHGLLDNLYWSPIAREILVNLPREYHRDLKKKLKRIPDRSRKETFEKTVEFLEEVLDDITAEIDFELEDKLDEAREVKKPDSKTQFPKKASNKKIFYMHTDDEIDSEEDEISVSIPVSTTAKPKETQLVHQSLAKPYDCTLCNGKHTHVFYCKVFQSTPVEQRLKLLSKTKICFRCLRQDSHVDFSDRESWWKKHSEECKTDFTCNMNKCGDKQEKRQMHFLLCTWHIEQNKARVQDFVRSLDKKCIEPTTTFLYNEPRNFQMISTPISLPTIDSHGSEILPDICEPGIYMVQNIATKDGKNLLLFFDSGCSGAVMSDRAYGLLDTELVRPGPTFLGVAGGETIELEHGDERFFLDIVGNNKKAPIVALRMPHPTGEFPVWELQEVWNELASEHKKALPKSKPLPKTDKFIGGQEVDIMIGIRYNAYFPRLVFMLPSGLGIYRSMIKSASGRQGVLGGPHKAWRKAYETANFQDAKTFFSAELRAYRAQDMVLRSFTGPVAMIEFETDSELDLVDTDDEPKQTVCSYYHCPRHQGDEGWKVEPSWDIIDSTFHIKNDLQEFLETQKLGTEFPYRCVRCRNCNDCRKGELLEKVSLQEEQEQVLIEDSVVLDVEKKRLVSKLPFVQDPALKLFPNRHIAEKVFKTQLKKSQQSEEVRNDIVKAHNKLLLNGYVKSEQELTPSEKDAMEKAPSCGYIIPWRTVYKEGSLSTPCRMVFDGSSRTPGGESLNGISAKGQNKLAKSLHLLVKFRSKPVALACDIKMAYNGITLDPAFYKFQKYLWKDDLLESNPTKVMIILTLIYGIRSSGNLTIAGLNKLGDHCIKYHPEHSLGAKVIQEDSYMDDIITSKESVEECKQVAKDIDFTLGLGSMSVKAYTISGQPPTEDISNDGETVGVIGYLWNSEKDTLTLDAKEIYLDKPKRGKNPEPIRGNLKDALKLKFTRRVITGRVASLYDPLGLVTAATAELKLHLHEICTLKVDWDDQIPEEYLEKWVKNLDRIQEIRKIKFRRCIIPKNAKSLKVDLIVSSDASENLALATVHSRSELVEGGYQCQLIAAKSKLTHASTIPRAELSATVIGSVLSHTVKMNMWDQIRDCFHVTDSTISLFWIHSDQRPLQTAVRNRVIEVRRLTNLGDWYHVSSEDNVADVGTRHIEISEIDQKSCWQEGKPWMSMDRQLMPIKTAAEVLLSGEEKRMAATELKAPDISGIVMANLVLKVGDRYSFSKYIVDPCRLPWPKAVRAMAAVFRFVRNLKARTKLRRSQRSVKKSAPVVFTDEEIHEAEAYFFRKTTSELRHFAKEKEWRNCTVLKDGILHYDSRILDGQEINDVENVMMDLNPLTFVRPMVDRFSPVAYSIMTYCHSEVSRHRNINATLRESRGIAYVIRGKDLATEIRENCKFCQRFKAKLLEVEMGKIHPSELTIAPVFYHAQVDLFGPLEAHCEHNHRSVVKAYGVIFKDPSTRAIAVYVMQKYDAPAFIQAFTRFASRHGYPNKLFIDQGTQLVKGCKDMELNWIDIAENLNSNHQVGIEFETCPVGGHNAHGKVERSVREVKKIFLSVFRGIKLDILSLETAFAWTSNELNNFPICLGSRYENLDHLDLITPARLMLGRNNRRAPGGYVELGGPSRLLEQMRRTHEAWWKVWKEEKIADMIPHPKKWRNSSSELRIGDIVVFVKDEIDQKFGESAFRIARIKDIERSKDGLVRVVILEYKNANEKTFRTTKRPVRKISVLHREGELDLVEELNEASKKANIQFLMEKPVKVEEVIS